MSINKDKRKELKQKRKQHRETLRQTKKLEDNRLYQERINELDASQRVERHHSDILMQNAMIFEQTAKQHENNIGLYKRFQKAEWLRWIFTTIIAFIALIISIFAFIQESGLDLSLCLPP